MRNLLNFILRNSSWLVAILLVAISFYLVFTHNAYQRSVYLTSANGAVGWFYETSSKVTSFFYLQKTNRELIEKNARLESDIQQLKSKLNEFVNDSIETVAFLNDSVSANQFSFIPANVVNISFSGGNNFVTVNKGSLQGVRPDMGVVSQNGVVGVVLTVSDRFSVIIPVINPKFRMSAKIKDSENSGLVSWNGKSPSVAQLSELPKHEVFAKGDTVLTSFSRIFPKDIVIGYVTEQIVSKDDNFNALNVALATDFFSLQNVLIIDDSYYQEQRQLENSLAE